MTDWLLWAPGLTEDNVRRIRPGMTLAEVEALLGGPATETIDFQAEGDNRTERRTSRRWPVEGPLGMAGDGPVTGLKGGQHLPWPIDGRERALPRPNSCSAFRRGSGHLFALATMKLLDQFRHACSAKHFSYRTEQAHVVAWPPTLGAPERPPGNLKFRARRTEGY